MRYYMHRKVYHALAHYSNLAFYFLVNKKEHTSHIIVRFVMVWSVQVQSLAYKPAFSLLRLLLPVSFFGWTSFLIFVPILSAVPLSHRPNPRSNMRRRVLSLLHMQCTRDMRRWLLSITP